MKRFLKRMLQLALVAFLLTLAFVLGRVWLKKDFVGVEQDYRAKSALLQSPPPGLSAPLEIKVVTFNIQDTWVVGRNRPERMRAIGAKLSLMDPDIVGFQEAFIPEDIEILKEELKDSRLKHWQYYPSGAVGSGVLTASVWPIKEVFFHRYTMAGQWWKIYQGDGAAGKGVGLARVELPDGQGFIDFFNTHAQAGYGNPYYRDPVRVSQMTELGQFVTGARLPNSPTLVVGDLNCRIGDKDYEKAIEHGKLVRQMTTDSRIDHILAVDDPNYTYEVLATEEIAEKFPIRGTMLELSDHSGWMSTLRITPKSATPTPAAAPEPTPTPTPTVAPAG